MPDNLRPSGIARAASSDACGARFSASGGSRPPDPDRRRRQVQRDRRRDPRQGSGALLDRAPARHGIGALPTADRDVEGVVEMMLDATQKYEEELTADRLFGWHASLFPTGRSGMRKITSAPGATKSPGRCRLSPARMAASASTTRRPPPHGSTARCRNFSIGSTARSTTRC